MGGGGGGGGGFSKEVIFTRAQFFDLQAESGNKQLTKHVLYTC